MKLTVLVALIIAFALTASAQPPPSKSTANIVTMEPVEIDTIGCRFNSWTLTAAGTATVSLIGPAAKPDAAPQAILIAGPTLADNTVTVQLKPDQGCGTSGCRNGNSYQVKVKATAGTDTPTCNFRVNVKKVVF